MPRPSPAGPRAETPFVEAGLEASLFQPCGDSPRLALADITEVRQQRRAVIRRGEVIVILHQQLNLRAIGVRKACKQLGEDLPEIAKANEPEFRRQVG